MRNHIVEDDLATIISASIDWSVFAGKTVLISGANGFLPAYMLETLLYLNEKQYYEPVKIIGLVRSYDRARERFAFYQERSDLRFITQDVSVPVNIQESVDYIIHAASQASPKYYGVDPVGTLSANILGTYNLLELAREKKSKGFLFFSSGEVYGEVSEKNIPTSETGYGYVDPLNVRSCYAESKRMAENMCVSWFHQHKVPIKIVRPFHTYGPGMRLDDGRVFADFVSNVVSCTDIEMHSDGRATRAFCYLTDATIGFFKVLLNGNNGEAYNVGNSNCEISIRDLAYLLANLFPEKGIHVIINKNVQQKGYLQSKIMRNCPDINKMRNLGWEPKVGLQDGFKKTIQNYITL
jgi:UDP-glucuronate decarboxylase